MLRSRIVPVLGVAILASAGSIGAFASSSGAATPAKTKTISCTKASGNIATTMEIKLSKCNGNTGGASKKINVTALASGGTIKWKNGKTTTVGAATLGTGGLCAPGSAADETVSGAVTGDTTGSAKPIPGVYSGEVCVDSSGNVSLAPGTALTLN